MTSIANASLSVNAMQMWLKFDKNRSKKMDHEEIKAMVEIVMGSTPSYEFMEELYTEWNLPSRQIDFKTWNELVPMKSNELQLRQRFRDIESKMFARKQSKPNREEDRNAWAKDMMKNTYKNSPSNYNQQAQLAGPNGIFTDQWDNEFRIEGRVIHGLEHFDDLRIQPNQNLVLIQKGKEFPAVYNDNEIIWADGDIWKKRPSKPQPTVVSNRRMPQTRKQKSNYDGDYQDQFGNRFAIDNHVVRGIDNFEGLDASEGGSTLFLQQSGKRYRGKFDPTFGINWQDGDIWKRDPPGASTEVELATRETKKPTLSDSRTPAFIDLLQGTFVDQHGNQFVVDGTKIFGLDGFERMSANPRGLVIVQSGVEYRASYDFNHIRWEDGDVWTKQSSSTQVAATVSAVSAGNENPLSGMFIDQYNNLFRIRDMFIEGLEGFEGLTATSDGRLKMQQKGAIYGAKFNAQEIIWDDQDVWKKSMVSLSGFSPGEYRLMHAAAVTSSFQKDSGVEMELEEGAIVTIEIVTMVSDRIRGKIADSGWVSMHSPQKDYTWVQPLSGGAPVTAGRVEVLSTAGATQSETKRPDMYSENQKQSGVWGKDEGHGVTTESYADFKFTPDAFRFYLIFAMAFFFSLCAIITVLTVDDWSWDNNLVETKLGFNTFSLLYQYEPITTFIAPPLWSAIIIFVFLYIGFQWVRTLMLRRLNHISMVAMKLYTFACILELLCFIFYGISFSVSPEQDIEWHIIPLIVFQLGLSITAWKNFYYYLATGSNRKKSRNSTMAMIYCISVSAFCAAAIWNSINLAARLADEDAPLPLEETMQIIWSIMLGVFMLIGCALGDSSETFAIRVNLLKS